MKLFYSITGTIFALVLLFLIYIYSGSYNPGSLSKHNGLTLWTIKTTLSHSIEKRAKNISVPSNLNDSSVIQMGFNHFNEMCTGCHGAPGIKPNEAAKGLYPAAPLIYKFANNMNPKTTFWVIKNGIKMSGMPALSPTHSDDKIWAITAFITKKLGKMNADEYKAWQMKYKSMDMGDDK